MLIWKFKFDLEPPDYEAQEQHMDSVLKPKVDIYLKVYQGSLAEEGAWGWASAWKGWSPQAGRPSGQLPWFPPLPMLCGECRGL